MERASEGRPAASRARECTRAPAAGPRAPHARPAGGARPRPRAGHHPVRVCGRRIGPGVQRLDKHPRAHEQEATTTAMAKISATLLALLATHACALGTEPTNATSTAIAEEWLEPSQPSVLSAATAVLRAVVMTPSPFRISVSGADASSAQRFQAAQASAAALLADNTLEWLLAQPNVADTVRDLLRTDNTRLEAREHITTPRHPSAANTSWDDVAPHATNWTARATEVQATREPLRQKNGTSSQEKTGSSSRAAVIEPEVNSPSTASAISKDLAAASMRPRRLDEGSGDAPCPATTAHLQAASEHAQLDFTGGYRNNDHCEWDVQCDQAVALHFTAMDTESNFDFVSLYDGGDENAPRLAHLSGRGTSAGTFAAAAGEMLVVFTSDSSNVADGFEAEYWCVSRESVGCTDSSAINYSPTATVDDGSCRCGDDHCGDTAALLQAFVVDPTAQGAWDALHGWGADRMDVCDWEGVSCTKDRVSGVDLSSKGSLKFEIVHSITKLRKLHTL